MSRSSNPSNATVVDKCTKRLTALKSYVTNGKTEIAIDGTTHKVSEVVAMYQNCLDTRAALATKRSETKAALNESIAAEATRRVADRALKAWVTNKFGVSSQQAIDFGFPPPKVPARTVDEKSKAVALGKATRVARNTMGPKEKLKIKGTLPVPTAPAAPATNTPQAVPVAAVVAQATSPQPLPTAASSPSASAPVNGAAAVVTNGASHF